MKLGRLRPLHRGVYAVGHNHVGAWGRAWAAVLACGEGAVVSHRSAAAAWKLLPVGSGRVDVSVPGDGQRRERAGIRVHRRAAFTTRDVTRRHGLPIRRHGLPRPETQVPIGPYRADFLWRAAKVVVEADSHAYHRRRFEEDRARDVALAARGYLALRVTKRALTPQTASRLHTVLSERLP